MRLRAEIAKLKSQEKTLIQMIEGCCEEMKSITRNPGTAKNAYVTLDDIEAIESFHGDSIIIIQASPGTTLEVPHPRKQKIQLYLKGAQQPPQVKWIYRNQDNDTIITRKLQSDIYNGILRYDQNDPISAEDMFQREMDVDVSWDTSMLAHMGDGIPVAKQAFAFDEQMLLEEPRFSFQLDRRFNVRHGEETPPMQVDGYSTSFQSATDVQNSRDDQPPIEMQYLERLANLKQKISLEELAFDLMVNPSEPVAFQGKTNGSSFSDILNGPQQGFGPQISEENLSVFLLQSMFGQMQPDKAQVVNTANEPSNNPNVPITDTPQTPFDISQDASLDDIDDVILSPLSPVMSDDMYYFAMRESEGLF